MEDDRESVQESATQRQHERTEHVESIMKTVRESLGDQQYPVSSEELSATYANEPMDLPNETESVGSVFDRLDKSFEDEEAAYEAFTSEFDRYNTDAETQQSSASAGPPYWDEETAENDERIDENDERIGEGEKRDVNEEELNEGE